MTVLGEGESADAVLLWWNAHVSHRIRSAITWPTSEAVYGAARLPDVQVGDGRSSVRLATGPPKPFKTFERMGLCIGTRTVRFGDRAETSGRSMSGLRLSAFPHQRLHQAW